MQSLPSPAPGYKRVCVRCAAPFGTGIIMPQAALALALTVFLLFLVAQFYPVAGIEMAGQSHAARIATDASMLADRAFSSLGLLVFGLVIAAPFMRVTALTWIFACLRWHHTPPYLTQMFRISEILRPWAMLDVLLLGIIVSNSKLRDLAQVNMQTGFWALGLAVLAIFAMEAAFDRHALWDALKPPPVFSRPPEAKAWISCHVCSWLQSDKKESHCARCGAAVHHRKRASLSQTWALVIAALILYIPANIYPVLITTTMGQRTSSTIIGGVRQLINGNDWPLAVILFTASIIIPLLKLFGFMWLMISVHYHHADHLMFRTRLYRFIYVIGRWSNTDIFVGASLTGLVTLGSIANVVPDIGGIAFAAVVALTMLAAETFDPRLIWDNAENSHGK